MGYKLNFDLSYFLSESFYYAVLNHGPHYSHFIDSSKPTRQDLGGDIFNDI